MLTSASGLTMTALATAVALSLAACTLLVDANGLVGASSRPVPGPDGSSAAVTDGGVVAREAGPSGSGFCSKRPTATLCADFPAGDGLQGWRVTKKGDGELSGPAGTPRSLVATVGKSGNTGSAQAYLGVSSSGAKKVRADFVFEVTEVATDGTHIEVLILSMSTQNDSYELDLILPTASGGVAVLSEYSVSQRQGPTHKLPAGLMPGVHEVSVTLAVDAQTAKASADVVLDGVAVPTIALSPPFTTADEMNAAFGITFVDTPHEPWAVRLQDIAVEATR